MIISYRHHGLSISRPVERTSPESLPVRNPVSSLDGRRIFSLLKGPVPVAKVVLSQSHNPIDSIPQFEWSNPPRINQIPVDR